MEQIDGIKYSKDSTGRRYVHIDLDMYGKNQLLKDFLDGLAVTARKGEPVYSFSEVIARENKRRGLDV
jgi:hypothetical protein